MAKTHPPDIEEFEILRVAARSQAERGQLDAALATLETALSWAEAHGTPEQIDLALCNRASLRIFTEDAAQQMPVLRKILMRSTSALNRHLAAYHISSLYDERQDFEKARFYARIALDHALRHGDAQHVASSHNRLGNTYVAESFFEEAREHYAQALALLAGKTNLAKALVLDNLAYGEVVLGSHATAFAKLFASLRMLRRLGWRSWKNVVHSDLAFAYLEIGRHDRALRHARAALRWAENEGPEKLLKNCLFLVGEAEKHTGNLEEAYQCFSRLQEQFFPGNPAAARHLMHLNVCKMINLKA